jgi:small subunit ribosomal protein S15
MHSRAKGKSGSTKPAKPVTPTWITMKPKEIEMLIAKYAKEGKSSSKIGIYLRDEHGIPSVKLITGKSVNAILKEKHVLPELPEDLMALMRKAVLIKKHQEENKKDMTAKRGLRLTESKINRLAKYYKKTGVLPQDWKYDPERIKLYVE